MIFLSMNNKHHNKRWVTLTLLLALVWTASAQNQLSLQDAIKVGLQNNFQIEMARLQASQAAINNTWGEAGRYPTVTLSAQQGNNIADQSQNPTSFIQALLISNSIQGGVNLDWVLFNGFRVKANKDRLQRVQEQSDGNAAIVVENTIQAIILAYYSVQLQEDKLNMLREVLTISKDRYDYNQIRSDLGTAVSVDLLQFQNAVLTDSSNVMLQEIALRNAKRNLNLLLNVASDTDYQLTDNFFENFPEYDAADLKSKMEANNQNLKNQYINSQIFSEEVKLAKSTMFPVLSFRAGTSVDNSAFRIGDRPSVNGTNLNYYGNFTLSFTLYNGGKVKRAIQAAEVQTKINNLQMDELKQTLNRDLTNALELYRTRLKIYALSKEAVAVARKNLFAAQERYEGGVINSFNYRDINTSYLNAGMAALESLYNLIDSKTELTRLTGGLVAE